MPTCTPIYGLAYPIGSDAPCDVDETFCEFAAQVDALLQGFESSLNRTARTIPMAKVSNAIAQALSGNIVFDTEEVDTEDMVDLSSSNLGVTIKRNGKFVSAAYTVQTDGAGTGALDLLINRNGFGTDSEAQRYGGNAVGNPVGNHGVSVTTFAARTSADLTPANWVTGDFVSLSPIGSIGTSITSIPAAEVMVYWTGDAT